MIMEADSERFRGRLKGDNSLGIFVGIANHDIHLMGGGLIVMLRGGNSRHTGSQDGSIKGEDTAEIAHHCKGLCRVRDEG